MPAVSIIIPVYNVEKYLRICLDSVLDQSFTNFEVICIDDCSTDGSFAILEEYKQKDGRIRIIQNKENLRAADTRNVGLNHAEGEYIYFIDADDYIDNHYLEEMWDMSQSSKADIVMNLNIKTDTNGKVTEYVHPHMPPIPEGGCYIDNGTAIDKSFCVVWMRLFKRKFLEDNNIRFQRVNMTEDNVFHFMTNINASSIYAFKGKSAYHYVLRDDSVTGIVKANNQRDLVTMKANDLIFDYLATNDLLEKNKAKIFNVYGFIKVDTEEKFDLYKSYFLKIKDYLYSHKELYNDMDLFFAESILSADDLTDYLNHYSPNVAIGFVKRKKT